MSGMVPIRILEEAPEWMAYAACLGMDPDIFFPERGEDSRPAKRVCAVCSVRSECLDWAIANHEKYGIFGGCNRKTRLQIATARRRAAA